MSEGQAGFITKRGYVDYASARWWGGQSREKPAGIAPVLSTVGHTEGV